MYPRADPKDKTNPAQSAGATENADFLSAEEKDSPNEFHGYETKQFHGEAPVLQLWRMWSTLSLPLLPGSQCPGVVVAIKMQSMG